MSSIRASWETDLYNGCHTQDSLLNDSEKEINPPSQPPETTENILARQQDVCLTISQSNTLNDYKFFPEDHYLVAGKWKSVFLDTSTCPAGLVLVVSLRYSSLSHENQPVKACTNDSKGKHPPADLCHEACFRLLCRDAGARVKYFLDDIHPTAEVALMDCKENIEIRFLCYSFCSHHRDYDGLTILKLGQRKETTREVVRCNTYTVRIAALINRRAGSYYNQDIHGKSSPNKSLGLKQKPHIDQEERSDSSISCKKARTVDSEGESNEESIIDQGVLVALNGASSSASFKILPTENPPIRASRVFLPPPGQEDSPLLNQTAPGNNFPSNALQQFGTEPNVPKPMVGPRALAEDTSIVSTSTKTILVQLKNHNYAYMIRGVVELVGGSYTELDLPDD